MGVESNFVPFITIHTYIITTIKIPEALILLASGKSG